MVSFGRLVWFLMSISLRELHVVKLGLRSFQDHPRGFIVAIFCNNVTAVSYLIKSGGLRMALLSKEDWERLHWAEEREVTPLP